MSDRTFFPLNPIQTRSLRRGAPTCALIPSRRAPNYRRAPNQQYTLLILSYDRDRIAFLLLYFACALCE